MSLDFSVMSLITSLLEDFLGIRGVRYDSDHTFYVQLLSSGEILPYCGLVFLIELWELETC